MREFLRERGEFEVVGREQRERLYVFAHVMRGGPGERQTVEGARAAADLVHEHQAVLGRVMQDVRRLGHLDHEGRAAAGKIVRRADAGEDAVDRADQRSRRPARNCRYARA